MRKEAEKLSREEHNGIDSKAPKGSTANPGHKEIKNEDSVLLRQNIADEERYFHEQNLLKERHRQEEFNKKKDDYSIDDYIASYEARYDDRFRENMSDTFEKPDQKDRKTAEEYKQVSYPEAADKHNVSNTPQAGQAYTQDAVSEFKEHSHTYQESSQTYKMEPDSSGANRSYTEDNGYFNQNTQDEERAYQERMEARPDYSQPQTSKPETTSYYEREEVIGKRDKVEPGHDGYRHDSSNYYNDNVHGGIPVSSVSGTTTDDVWHKDDYRDNTYNGSDIGYAGTAAKSYTMEDVLESQESGYFNQNTQDEERAYQERMEARPGYIPETYGKPVGYENYEETKTVTGSKEGIKTRPDSSYRQTEHIPDIYGEQPYSDTAGRNTKKQSDGTYYHDPSIREIRPDTLDIEPENEGYFSSTVLDEQKEYQSKMSERPGQKNHNASGNRTERNPFGQRDYFETADAFGDTMHQKTNGPHPQRAFEQKNIERVHSNSGKTGETRSTLRSSGARHEQSIRRADGARSTYFNQNTLEAERAFQEKMDRHSGQPAAGSGTSHNPSRFTTHTAGAAASFEQSWDPHNIGRKNNSRVVGEKNREKKANGYSKSFGAGSRRSVFEDNVRPAGAAGSVFKTGCPQSFGTGSRRNAFEDNVRPVRAAGSVFGTPPSTGMGNLREAEYANNLMTQYDVIDGREPAIKEAGDSTVLPKSYKIGNLIDARQFRAKKVDINGSREVNQILNTCASLEKSFVNLSARFIFDAGTLGTDTRIGYDIAKDIYGTIGILVAGKVLNSQAKYYKNRMEENLVTFIESLENVVSGMQNKAQAEVILERFGITNVSSVHDMHKLLNGINFILGKNGLAPLELNKGTVQIQVFRYICKNRKALSGEMRKLLTDFASLGGFSMYAETLKRRLPNPAVSLFYNHIMRYARQNDAGAGTLLILNTVGKTKSTLRAGWSLARKTASLTKLMTLSVAKTAAWASAKAAQTKAGKKAAKVLEKTTKTAKSRLPAGDPKKKTVRKKKRKKFSERAKRFKGRTGNFFRKVSDFRADPFHLRARRNEVAKNLTNKFFSSKVGRMFSPFRVVHNALNKILSMIMSLISVILSVILLMIGILLLAMIAVLMILTIFTTIISLFDFTSNDEEIINSAMNTIKQCYEAQNSQIMTSSASYRNVNIQYTDVKDQDVYNSEENKPESPFTETTNSAELLSMATVYFDFDLEDAGKEKVNDYITKLYNGSHLLSVVEHPHEEELDDETKITYVDADITLTTYYFNSLFNCKLTSSAGFLQTGTIAAGTSIDIPQDFAQCVTRTDYDRIKWNRATGQGILYYNNWIPQGRKFDDGIAYLECGGQKRYLIAVASTFGTVGDYVDVYFANGSVLPCIIADAKSNGDANITQWGHKTGNAISVLEMETQHARAVSSATGNPGHGDWWPQLGQKVVKIVNGGSFFSNPNGPTG